MTEGRQHSSQEFVDSSLPQSLPDDDQRTTLNSDFLSFVRRDEDFTPCIQRIQMQNLEDVGNQPDDYDIVSLDSYDSDAAEEESCCSMFARCKTTLKCVWMWLLSFCLTFFNSLDCFGYVICIAFGLVFLAALVVHLINEILELF